MKSNGWIIIADRFGLGPVGQERYGRPIWMALARELSAGAPRTGTSGWCAGTAEGQSAGVQVEFLALRSDGTIDARLAPDWPILNEALADAVSSLPPRGSEETRLSTYWIDQTLNRLGALQRRSEEGVIASGNAYSLMFDGDGVRAVFDYGDANEDVELMSVDDFVGILEGWRAAVVAAQAYETRTVPETYRRNPWP